MAEFVTSLTDLTKSRPRTDAKEYKLAVLPGGMKVLLVSSAASPGRDRAAASMTVGVGTFSDPPEVAIVVVVIVLVDSDSDTQ
jgi:secreted Zn-dependent insulinase-like peptidase